MPMATCLRGYMLKMGSNPKLTPAIQKCLKQLQTQALNAREQVHVDALTAWVNHQEADAMRRIEALLDEHPKDMMALRVAHHLHFYTGDSEALKASVERRLAFWDEDDPHYGYVLGMYSFGLEEAAEYREAEIVGRRACELNPQDIWAGHAMVHVLQMQGRWIDGIEWIDAMLPYWQDANNFRYHLHWHKALYYLGRRELDAALAIYDDVLEPALDDDFYLDACNAASLLWRLNMLGIDTSDRWQKLHDLSLPRLEDDELVFCSLHYLMAPAMRKDQVAIDKALANFDEWRARSSTQGEVVDKVGLDLARAIVDLTSGEGARGAQTLARLRRDVMLIGGSWVQRELFKDLQAHYETA